MKDFARIRLSGFETGARGLGGLLGALRRWRQVLCSERYKVKIIGLRTILISELFDFSAHVG
jgi:hypothetical protein